MGMSSLVISIQDGSIWVTYNEPRAQDPAMLNIKPHPTFKKLRRVMSRPCVIFVIGRWFAIEKLDYTPIPNLELLQEVGLQFRTEQLGFSESK